MTTKKKKQGTNKITIKGIIIGIVTFLLITMSLFHIFWNELSHEQKSHKKTYKAIIKKRDSINYNIIEKNTKKLLSLFPENDSIKSIAESLSKGYNSNFESIRSNLKEYHKTKRELNKKQAFLGRSSFRFWLAYFGISVGFLFFSIKSLRNDIQKGSNFRFHFVSLTGVIVSSFWIIHFTLLTQKDFLKNTYVIFILISALLISVFTYFLVKNYTYKDDIILSQLSLIERIKTIHYPNIAVKAMYAEKYGKPSYTGQHIDTTIDEFQKDINKTLKID
ncbi:hypothetical protein [uncultured Tenacibaculum sp.]|uniref:hypothetical protein n=1 Tax=uncultured Tenacibaculum sp. TaxID=174713 RepID=UPI00260BB993|nr:hypothetical protein [uncultured Tenacibaculum sp.]